MNCPSTAHRCTCSFNTGNHDLHVCECEGSWTGGIDTPYEPVGLPRVYVGPEEGREQSEAAIAEMDEALSGVMRGSLAEFLLSPVLLRPWFAREDTK